MVNRPPFDRDPPPPPGGFDPRFGSDRGPPPAPGREPVYGGRPDPYAGRPDPYGAHPETYGGPPPRGPDPFDRRSAPPPLPPHRPGMARSTKWLLALGGLLLLGAILFGLSLTRAGPGSDALDEGKEKNAASDPEARCAAPATYEKIKRELFREAATARGADLAAYDRLAGYAVIRVSEPVLREVNEGEEQVRCSGTVALDLPPGVVAAGGRRSLSARLGYSLQPAADGVGDVVTLEGADALVRQLATLGRTGAAAGASLGSDETPAAPPVPEPAPAPSGSDTPAPSPEPIPVPAAPPPPPPRPAPEPREQRVTAPEPRPQATANPSFNCARASNRAERAICGSPELASLDRQMASRFFAARGSANTTQRVLLDRTRGAFLAFRNRCGSDACIADAYRGRIREINDIMADRWVAPN